MNKDDLTFWLRHDSRWPTTILCDRYGGSYSGALWIAFPLELQEVPAESQGDDSQSMEFWDTYEEPVGKGDSPQIAFMDLVAKMLNALSGMM
jgi:hypothetical protein